MDTRKVGRSRAIKQAVNFFFEHAGYSYDPKTETPEQGKLRCAKSYAQAERDAASAGITFEWHDDWEVGNHYEFYGESYGSREPETCETCIARNAQGEVVASLGCIDDSNREYRRVIQAELAMEALS